MSGYGARRVFFTYYRCEICGALYCPLFYTPEQLEKLYGSQTENMAEVPLAARQRTQNGYADLLMKHSRRGGGFLEIGSDIGLFAERCATLGSFDHMWLFEPNRNVHAELSARLTGRPHSIRVEMRPTADVPPRSISTAALIHVLDHLLGSSRLPRSAPGKARGRWRRPLAHPQHQLPPGANTRPTLSALRAAASATLFSIVDRAASRPHRFRDHRGQSSRKLFSCHASRESRTGGPQHSDIHAGRVRGPAIPIKLGNMAVMVRKRATHEGGSS